MINANCTTYKLGETVTFCGDNSATIIEVNKEFIVVDWTDTGDLRSDYVDSKSVDPSPWSIDEEVGLRNVYSFNKQLFFRSDNCDTHFPTKQKSVFICEQVHPTIPAASTVSYHLDLDTLLTDMAKLGCTMTKLSKLSKLKGYGNALNVWVRKYSYLDYLTDEICDAEYKIVTITEYLIED